MNRRNETLLAAFAGALAGACAGSAPTDQVVSGRAELATFPSPVISMRAVRAGQVVVGSDLAAGGAFSLSIPPDTGYRIELVSAEQPTLVYPRRVGRLDVAFDVRGSGTFDLGAVRYVGDPTARTYQYPPAPGQAGSDGDGDDGECEDGVDPSTGAVCVDDDDEEGADECGADGDQTECEDGIDPSTGAECDGGPSQNQDDGEQDESTEDDGSIESDDGDDGDENDDLPAAAAVADHNLPASVGCEDGESDGEEEDN